MGARALSRGLTVASLLGVMSLAGKASAQANAADSERANLLFKKGKVAFNDGKYADALRIYAEAWRLKQSPDIAANLAQTESELGKHRDAAEHYAFALAHLLPSSTDEQKSALAEGLSAEKKETGSLHVTLEPVDAALTLDEQPVTLPPNGDLFVEPGEHVASVTREGYQPSRQTVRISKGAAQVLWIRLPQVGATAGLAAPTPGAPAEPKPPPDLHESSGRSIVPALVGGGLFVAGAAFGVVFLASGNASNKDADALRSKLTAPNACGTGTPNSADCSALHAKNSDVDHARTLEGVGFAVAGAAAVGTALYLLWPHSSTASATRWSPSVAVAPGFGNLAVTGRF